MKPWHLMKNIVLKALSGVICRNLAPRRLRHTICRYKIAALVVPRKHLFRANCRVTGDDLHYSLVLIYDAYPQNGERNSGLVSLTRKHIPFIRISFRFAVCILNQQPYSTIHTHLALHFKSHRRVRAFSRLCFPCIAGECQVCLTPCDCWCDANKVFDTPRTVPGYWWLKNIIFCSSKKNGVNRKASWCLHTDEMTEDKQEQIKRSEEFSRFQ